MPAVLVPTVVVLVILAAVGCTVANYAGMTIPEALDYAKNNHDYTCPDSVFESIYDDWHEVQDANKPITYQDIQTVLGMGKDYYNGVVDQWTTSISYVLGAFDQTWTADVSSREIRVYDENGNLKGATTIVGSCENQISYANRVQSPPAMHQGGFMLFKTSSSEGVFYHTDIRFAYSDGSGYGTTAGWQPSTVGWWGFEPYDEFYSNVAFTPSTRIPNAFNMKGVSNNQTFVDNFNYVSWIDGTNDLEVTWPSIGDADIGNGQTATVRPDGSVVLPDGTVVYPNSQTGEYPFPVELNPDWWKTLSDLLSQDATNDDTKTDTQIINLNLDGIRAQIASILDYIKQGFWADFKTFWLDFFKVDTSKLNPNTYSQYGIADRFLRWADALFYGLTGQHLSTQGG